MRYIAALVLGLFVPVLARAQGEKHQTKVVPAEVGGMLIVTSTESTSDLRLGRIAAGFANRNYESFVSADMLRPPPFAGRELVRGRWRLNEAQRLRQIDKHASAAEFADQAMQLFQRYANDQQHLSLLVEALVERGAIAIAVDDLATAETVFLNAIALDPLYELPEDHGEETKKLYGAVLRASRQLRYGSLHVDVANMPDATIKVDFRGSESPPYETKLPDGRHFISVHAPGRHEVVMYVPVRAGRQTTVSLRPPLAGDVRARADALAKLSVSDPESIRVLAQSAGMRFVVPVKISKTNIGLRMIDGQTGAPVAGGEVTLSLNPNRNEIDAAVTKLLNSGVLVEPELIPKEEGPSWYTTWWGMSLIGVAATGAAVATYVVVDNVSTTEYRFTP